MATGLRTEGREQTCRVLFLIFPIHSTPQIADKNHWSGDAWLIAKYQAKADRFGLFHSGTANAQCANKRCVGARKLHRIDDWRTICRCEKGLRNKNTKQRHKSIGRAGGGSMLLLLR